MEGDSTTTRIINQLLLSQSVKYDQNVKHKLNEFVIKYCSNLIEDSMQYAGHANKDSIDENDVRLTLKNSKEKTSKLDTKDLEEAERLKAKYQIKDIKDTPSINLGAQELESAKPMKHLVTYQDLNQNKSEQKPANEQIQNNLRPPYPTENREFASPGPSKRVKIDNPFLE